MFEREPNIDIVFRNGLKNLEVLPPADVWDNIPPMPVRTSRLRIISGIAAGVAALVSLTLLATWYVRNTSTPVLLSRSPFRVKGCRVLSLISWRPLPFQELKMRGLSVS
jgi:hypothetical protein